MPLSARKARWAARASTREANHAEGDGRILERGARRRRAESGRRVDVDEREAELDADEVPVLV